MIEETKIQSQGRIRRQMIEQSLARPMSDDIVIVSTPRSKSLMAELMNRMTDQIAHRLNTEMLKTNPMVQIKSYEDKIKIDTIHPGRVFIGADYAAGNSPEKIRETNFELTLVNGVYE